jgi:hypothetical protein
MSARQTIENLWDRATPVAPLLLAHQAETTEGNAAWLDSVGEADAARLLRAVAADIRTALDARAAFEAMGGAA